VRLNDLPNDEQTQPDTSEFGIVMTASDHRLEQIPKQRLRYRGAEVVHGYSENLIFKACGNGDFAIAGTVGDCIGDQIADELINPIAFGRKNTLPQPKGQQNLGDPLVIKEDKMGEAPDRPVRGWINPSAGKSLADKRPSRVLR